MSGLYEGLFVMKDAQTGSQWLHYTGECIEGPQAGKSLTMLSTQLLYWPAFQARFPSATVIANSTSWLRRLMALVDGRREAPSFFRLPKMFTRTMREHGSALPDMTFGLGLVLGQRSALGGTRAAAARFYPVAELRRRKVVQEEVAGQPLVLVWDETGGTGACFRAELDGQRRALRESDAAQLRDDEGNVYDLSGRVVSGPSQGQRLSPVPLLATRWYGFLQTYPECTVLAAPVKEPAS